MWHFLELSSAVPCRFKKKDGKMVWVGLFFPKEKRCTNPLRVETEVKKDKLRVTKAKMGGDIYELKYDDEWYPADLVAYSGMYEHAP